jgi:wyosine [tRNA(Phe)-imidazoG37] synthetase (radical SAM superfamily)
MDAETKNQTGYTYGPVPSRRLGLSLGVDIVTPKVCTLDCVYCQLGRTTRKSAVREDFVDIGVVLREIREKVEAGLRADYITIGGSGEPTLNARLGDLIDGIRALTRIPVAILTNGTLFYRADVRADCAKADVVMPTLAAGEAAVFAAVNRPTRDITIEKLISGLRAFRREFTGQIWLEVFLVADVNTDPAQIEKIRNFIEQIQPEKVHLNTAVRPPAEPEVRAVPRETMLAIVRRLGPTCEVIGEAPTSRSERHDQHGEAEVVSVLRRRPCSLEDLATGLRMDPAQVAEYVANLQGRGLVTSERRGSITYFHIRPEGAR